MIQYLTYGLGDVGIAHDNPELEKKIESCGIFSGWSRWSRVDQMV
jgi:hypothetical protein